MNMKQEALRYRQRGWSVVPVRPMSKIPAVRSWKPYCETAADERQVAKWWPNDDKGIAVVLGEVSGGLICRDFDRMDSYDAWAMENREVAEILPTVATARGRHVYCRADISELLTQLEGSQIKPFPDGELRIAGCICLLPPTWHETGVQYRWMVEPTDEIPLLDPFLIGFLKSWSEGTDVTERDGEGHRRTEKTDARVDISRIRKGGNVVQPQRPFVNGLPDSIPADVLSIIAQTIPLGPGLRHRQVFELARGLKSIPWLAEATAKEVKSYVRYWHRFALDKIRTKPFEETWIDFFNAWDRVKFPLGAEPIQQIFETACQTAIPEFALEYELEGVLKLIMLCRELQRQNPEGPFYLSVRTAQRLLELPNAMVAQRWLSMLRVDEVIKEVTKGAMKFQKQKNGKKPKLIERKASRYRYLKELD